MLRSGKALRCWRNKALYTTKTKPSKFSREGKLQKKLKCLTFYKLDKDQLLRDVKLACVCCMALHKQCLLVSTSRETKAKVTERKNPRGGTDEPSGLKEKAATLTWASTGSSGNPHSSPGTTVPCWYWELNPFQSWTRATRALNYCSISLAPSTATSK